MLEMLAARCVSDGAKDAARALAPSSDRAEAERRQTETSDARDMMTLYSAPSFDGVKDIRDSLKRADAGGMLNTCELTDIAHVLRAARNAVSYASGDESGARSIGYLFSSLHANRYLEDKITNSIVGEGELADSASTELADIRRAMRVAGSKVREALQKIITSPTYAKVLQEPIITVKNGRYVVPVKAEHKGAVPGLTHDISSSGATLFIEPISAVKANNEIRELLAREEREVERILRELSAEASDFSESIALDYNLLTQLDLIFAKAKLSYDLNCARPAFSDNGEIVLKKARHPLLRQSEAVPIDIELGGGFDTLVITGPNTGGKTVSLKTLGLLCLMAQCGLHIPAGDESSIPLFQKVLADIGGGFIIQPEWTTYQSFRWKLSLDKLDTVLEYISSHPKSADSMAKSSFIFRFLQNHENMLSGTVYVGGSSPNIPNTYSDIVIKLRQDGAKYQYYGMRWNGKWLFTESGELVSQKEITKKDLHPQLYGNVRPESNLYEILGFAKSEEDQLEEAAKEYDRLDDETKEQFFEIELRRRFGISITDLEESYGSGATGGSTASVYTSQGTFVFPTAKVKNWDSLRKHVAEVLVFARPVKYEYKVRKIRVSKPDSEIDAYLRSMYRVEGSYKYACQMCHEPVLTFEKCQLYTGMEKELDAMYLCMCLNCASEYRKMRSDEYALQEFLEKITYMDEQDINSHDPVKIAFENESIWFTQTHIAEIKELMALKDAVDEYVESSSKPVKKADLMNAPDADEESEDTNFKAKDDPEAEVVVAGTDVYKDYIGKRVFHKAVGYGIVRTCDGKYLGIEFGEGPKAGKVTNYSLEACLSKNLIQIV